MTDSGKVRAMTPRRRGTFSGALYENTDDLKARLAQLLEDTGKSQIAVAKELAAFIGSPVHESSISNILTGRHPSSKFGAALAELYGWPIPPVARTRKHGRARAMDPADVAMLEEIHSLSAERYRWVKLVLEGEVLKLRGQRMSRQGLDQLLRETGVREVDPDETPDDDG